MRASLSKLVQDIMSLMSDVVHQVNHPGLLHAHHLPFIGGFGSVFACWFTNLSWHIAGFVTIAKFQKAQVAKVLTRDSQVSHMPAISPARAANVATHAWTTWSFTMKSWAGFLAFAVHAMHDWLYLKWPQPLSIFVPPVSGLQLMVGRSTNQK